MRPVDKPLPADQARPRTPMGLRIDTLTLRQMQLRDAIGEYCSFCEMPINVTQAVASKRLRALKRVPSLDDWDDLLLACDYCQAQRTGDALDTSRYLWPDKDATFSVGPDSPFVYALKEVNYVVTVDPPPPPVDPRPSSTPTPLLAPGKKTLAIVSANPSSPDGERAKNTLDLFQLNTPYYDAGTNTYTIPDGDLQAGRDTRVEQRTRAWGIAASAIATLDLARGQSSTIPIFYEGVVKMNAAVAQGTGFWSCWMTAAWAAFGDPALTRALLLQIDRRDGYQVVGNQTVPDGGHPPWTIFMGTALSRL